MNLRDMQYLVTTAELLNFSAAADACHVSQPTLSGQIKKTEELLGIKIFERSNKKVILTAEGKEVVACARNILKENENIKQIALNAKDPLAGSFRLGAFPTLAPYLFPKIIPSLKKALPKLKLILVEDKTSQLIEKLKSGEIDAAFLALPVEEPELSSLPLFKDQFFLAVPKGHNLAQKSKICLTDMDGLHLLLLEEGHCLREQALEVCSHSGADEENFRSTSLETVRQMVKAGTGITLIPEIAVDKSDSNINYLPFIEPAPNRIIAIVYRKTMNREAIIRAITDILKC